MLSWKKLLLEAGEVMVFDVAMGIVTLTWQREQGMVSGETLGGTGRSSHRQGSWTAGEEVTGLKEMKNLV